jgi:large subunit ribosomal protein L22
MDIASAQLNNYRQSPRKVRLVTDLIRGKSVVNALIALEALPKRASLPIAKLLRSALSNAKSKGSAPETLYVSRASVDKGIIMKRSMPRARGSASRINKRTSKIIIAVAEKAVKAAK